MRQRRLFVASTVAFALLYLAYGLKRFSLGVDFTDEGAYAAWPLRMLFGERLFSAELGTLLRPLAAHLFVIFRIAPGTTLFEFRLIGWTIHLGAFVLLALCGFRIGGGPLRSPLIASIPFFVCHLFGLASPSYNNLSSDFFSMALSLRLLAELGGARRPAALQSAAGGALFLATLAHPVLGVAAAAIVGYELFRRGLAGNLLRWRLSPSNLGVLVFIGAWILFALYLVLSGAAGLWLTRVRLFQSFTASSIEAHPRSMWFLVMAYPFAMNRYGIAAGLLTLGSWCWLRFSGPASHHRFGSLVSAATGLLLLFLVLYGFSYHADYLPLYFSCAALCAIGIAGFSRKNADAPRDPAPFLLGISAFAAVLYATVTYYFSPLRSWSSGMLALPFGFTVGIALLLRVQLPRHHAAFRLVAGAALALLTAGVAWDHFRTIYRDGPPPQLTAAFRAPKLARIRTTPQREQSVDALYDYLHPKLARGEPLLVYDDCPLLYFLFDAKPAYGLAWAARYTQGAAALAELDREFRSAPLPRYAIRLVVDPSDVDWEKAPRADYGDYPLNATVTARYQLERTIFPFEIWRLKPAGG
ncbi:MAG: hypothetical protein JWM88_2656 [Verrucomicrobia bacterium]|nr:hypothetical protein [Verrucomicrobiota bacterium]